MHKDVVINMDTTYIYDTDCTQAPDLQTRPGGIRRTVGHHIFTQQNIRAGIPRSSYLLV